MMHDRRLWLLLLLAGIGGWQWWQGRPVSQPPGELAVEPPTQSPTTEPVRMYNDFELRPRAYYDISARLLRRENYRFDRGAALAPRRSVRVSLLEAPAPPCSAMPRWRWWWR